MMPNMDIRQQLVQYYRWLRQHGCNDSHSGNVSVRDGTRIWITPTGACADSLDASELIACELDAAASQGASQDAPLHMEIYRRCTRINAVFHSHGPHSIGMSLNGQDFMPADYEGQLYFPRVPVISVNYADYEQQSPELVATALEQYPIAIVRGHGVYAAAENLNLAYKWTCSLEQSAKIALIAQQAAKNG